MKKLVLSLTVIAGLLLSGCGHFRKGCCSCDKACACAEKKDGGSSSGCADCKDKK